MKTNNPTERSKIMHLLRYKEEDHSEDNKPLVKALSDITVQTLTNNLSKIIQNSYTKNIEKNLQKLIFIYPNSRSPFNNNVSQQLLKKYPNIKIISLNKNTLKDIPQDKLFPLKNISLSDTQLRLQWILNSLYENYRKLYPDQPFSRETLSKELRKFFVDSINNNNIKIENSKTNKNFANLTIFNYTLPIQHTQRDIQRLKDSNSFYDISENIIKQNKANIFNTQNLENIQQPGNIVIAFRVF